MISFRARLIRFVSKQYFKRITPDRDVHELRERWNALAARLPDLPGIDVRKTSIAGIDCDWLVPRGCEDAPILYYLHGGAYLMGSPLTHRRLLSVIAREAGVRALLPDYRLSPEHRFPAALEDSRRVYDALVAGGENAPMAIGGDSAGGNLAAATLLSLRDAGKPLPAAAVLLSPWLDLAAGGESHRSMNGIDPWFRTEHMPAIAANFCGPDEVTNPLISPVYADAHGLPPTLIQVGEREILRSDSERFADSIRSAGGEATLETWPGMWHVFQFFVGRMPESDRAIRNIAEFLASKLETQAAATERAA